MNPTPFFEPNDDLDLIVKNQEAFKRLTENMADKKKWRSTKNAVIWMAADIEVIFDQEKITVVKAKAAEARGLWLDQLSDSL